MPIDPFTNPLSGHDLTLTTNPSLSWKLTHLINQLQPIWSESRSIISKPSMTFNQYARSLGYMDWANQPDPFRRYEGAPLIRLPLT